MTPHEFVDKWHLSTLKERSAAQEHFIDLCGLLGEKTPAGSDGLGKDYAFEFGATKTTGGHGFADVFKRGHFGWEYKGTRANLDTALEQLRRYEIALDRPPLLIVSDIGTMIRVHTNWTNSVSRTYEIAITDLVDAEHRSILKAAFTDPESLRPAKTRQQLTEEVAGEFAKLTRSLRDRGHGAEEVAHFVNRLVFCMFAEDVDLLPNKMFTRMLERALDDPHEFAAFARDLFRAMKDGGRVGFDRVAWFNGGLFDGDSAFDLTRDEIKTVHNAAVQYWGDIDPAILGTLFERGLDPTKRSQLGAHYTDRAKIEMIVGPAVTEPIHADWEVARAEIEANMVKAAESKGATRTRTVGRAQAALDDFLARLRAYRVLDPACGSGNFLYVALKALKDLEHRALVEAEAMGLPRRFPEVGPDAVLGIELNPYAAELARVSVWIGEIQWMMKNGFAASRDPILKPLDTIACRDALMTEDDDGVWREAEWPVANAIVGNPPFLGGKMMRGELGGEYVERLFTVFKGVVPPEADLVVYWFAKGARAIREGATTTVGLVSTNSVRGGANRRVLDSIADDVGIVTAWADQPWTVEGAAVRVSMVVFGPLVSGKTPRLDGRAVTRINSDLTSGRADLTKALRLPENSGVAFMGDTKGGPFDVSGDQARRWLQLPTNPNGQTNADVLRPWINGLDVTRRPRDMWIVDFGWKMSEAQAALYEAPFTHAETNVKPERAKNRRELYRANWWRHVEARQGMWRALDPLCRYIATARVAKHRLFMWRATVTVPDSQVIVIARDDDTAFGILHSRFHEVWSLRMGTSLEDRPRYTPTTTFETFPFPVGLGPNTPAADYAADPRAIEIAEVAARLVEQRDRWLNPPELVRVEPEVVSGFPDRVLPVDGSAEGELKKRTLTNLYNDRPKWLDNAHRDLDAAVARAYGWHADISDDDALERLFALNQSRAGVAGPLFSASAAGVGDGSGGSSGDRSACQQNLPTAFPQRVES